MYQVKCAAELVTTTPPDKQNVYPDDELALWQQDPKKSLPNKQVSNFKDPFKVTRHTKNDVECRYLVMKNVCMFDVPRVKMFHGSEQDGYEAAKIDASGRHRCYLQLEECSHGTEVHELPDRVRGPVTIMDSVECRP